MTRWIAVAAVAAVLAGLLTWKWQRERRVAACTASGGVWHGPSSECRKAPPSPILQRGIERG